MRTDDIPKSPTRGKAHGRGAKRALRRVRHSGRALHKVQCSSGGQPEIMKELKVVSDVEIVVRSAICGVSKLCSKRNASISAGIRSGPRSLPGVQIAIGVNAEQHIIAAAPQLVFPAVSDHARNRLVSPDARSCTILNINRSILIINSQLQFGMIVNPDGCHVAIPF